MNPPSAADAADTFTPSCDGSAALITRRPLVESAADAALNFAIYASTREEELALAGWGPAEKEAFLRFQFEAQRRYYISEYPGAEFQIIEVDGQAAGRLSVHRRPTEIRIMDIALLPEFRGRGLGTRLLRELLAEGRQTGRKVSIHVETFNPAQRLYARLGFTHVSTHGVHHLMECHPDSPAASAPAASPDTGEPRAHDMSGATAATGGTPATGATGRTASGVLGAVVVFFLVALGLVGGPCAARAQGGGVTPTLTTALSVTPGGMLTYTSVVANAIGVDLTAATLQLTLDPNTTLVPGSVQTSPLALPDAYSVLGNVSITRAAPGLLINDVDPDGVGPALSVAAGTIATTRGGSVVLNADGGFTYHPPAGLEGTDAFNYTVSDGEGFTDIGTVTLTVSGMIWFVNPAAAPGGDGRLGSPFQSLASLAAINNGSGNNPGPGDTLFLYTGAHAGPLTLLANQKLVGQGAGASLAAITGLTPPPGSAALPATGGTRPVLIGNSGGLTLASGNLVRGLNVNVGGGIGLSGLGVGALHVSDASVTNSAGTAVQLAGGTLDVTLGALFANGGTTGLRLVNCGGRFSVTGGSAQARDDSGGGIQVMSGNGVILEGATNVSLARMNINRCGGNGISGFNVNGLVVNWCTLESNGDGVNEGGIRLGDPVAAVNGLVGTLSGGSNPTRLANSLIRASGEMNVALFNNGGTLSALDVTNVVFRDTRGQPTGADGCYVETRGAAIAQVQFNSCQFSNHVTQGIQATALAQSALTINVVNCGFTNNNEGIVLANGNDADLNYDLNGNRFASSLPAGGSGSAIAVVNATTATGGAIASGRIRNNLISGGGIDNHLVTALLAGSAQSTFQIANNTINAPSAQFSGIFVQAGETGSGNPGVSVTITTNNVTLGALGSHGIVVQSRITATLCAELAGNVSTTGGVGLFGINVRQRDTSTFRLPGFAGPFNSLAAVVAYLQGRNSASVGATIATTFTGGVPCVQPLLAGAVAAEVEPAVRGVSSGPGVQLLDPVGFTAAGVAREGSGEAAGPGPQTTGPRELHPHHLDAAVVAARQRWARAGLTTGQLARIDSVQFAITDLGGRALGASSGRLVQLDRQAAGHGWFIDATPDGDEEFAPAAKAASEQGPGELGAGSQGTGALTARPSSGAAGHIDLLTAVLHEQGHHLGLPDDYSAASAGELMHGFLPPGERRLPGVGTTRAVADPGGHAADDALALGLAPGETHFLFAPINLGTLPAGKSITVTFRVVVANPVSAVCAISNQVTLVASTPDGLISLPSDDPRTAALSDPTVTDLLAPPIARTVSVSGVTATTANFAGTVLSRGGSGGYYFIYRLATNPDPLSGTVVSANTLAGPCVQLDVSGAATGLTPATAYTVTLVASNSFGFSFGGQVTFTTPVPGFLHPPADAFACAGGVAGFAVTMEAGAVGRFQWQRRAPGGSEFTDILNATNRAYVTPPVTVADHGALYRVTFTSAGITIVSPAATLSVDQLLRPTVTYDFNNGLPAGTAVYGHAFIDPAFGVLELNTNAPGQTGAFLTADLAPGRLVRGFTAVFRARVNGGSFPPADGFSFNWATDLPNGTYAGVAEEGEGSGLRVCVDTWDNGFSEAPAIDVWWGPNLVARAPLTIPFLARGPEFFTVHVRLTPDGLLDVDYACQPIFARLPIPGYTPLAGARFGLGARTGAAFETHSIDDLALALNLDETNGRPRITSIELPPAGDLVVRGVGTPGQSYGIETSLGLATWAWARTVVAAADGTWEFTDFPGRTPRRFYRLRAAPQFPNGLVNWWRAETNHVDSFGPNDALPLGPATFVAGQRGQAFAFDGVGPGLNVGASAIPVPWTAGFWIRREDALDASAAVLADGASALKLEQWPSSRALGLTQFGVADYYFGAVTPVGTWTHVTMVATGAGTVLYLNGVQQEAQPFTVSLPRGVFGQNTAGTDRLRGALDEVTLFDRALSPDEVKQVYNASRGP